LHDCAINSDLKRQALEDVQAAKSNPVPDNLAKVVSVLDRVQSAVVKTAGAMTAIGAIGGAIAKLAGLC
jgi:hypothetical protein